MKLFKPTSMSIFLTAMVLFGPAQSFGVVACNLAFAAEATGHPYPASPQWRKTPSDAFSAVRANAYHNWAYFKNVKPQSEAFRKVWEFEGEVVGDFHLLNLSDIELKNGKIKIGLVDVDDSGRGSLLADFTRGVIGNQVSPYQLPLATIWKSYKEGLRGKSIETPKVISKLLEKSQDDFLDHQSKVLEKNVDGDKFSSDAGLSSVTSATGLVAQIYKDNLDLMKLQLKGSKILDVGYKIKVGGGSQGIPRFWFLVSDKGEQRIVEFKVLGEPAVALFEPQANDLERFLAVQQVYRSEKSLLPFDVVQGTGVNFLVRQVYKGFLKFDPLQDTDKKDIEAGQDYYLYLFNLAGQWHRQITGTKLLEAIENDESKVFQEFSKITSDYLALMAKENK